MSFLPTSICRICSRPNTAFEADAVTPTRHFAALLRADALNANVSRHGVCAMGGLVLSLSLGLLGACENGTHPDMSRPVGAVQEPSESARTNSLSEFPVPRLIGRVNDYANILTSPEHADLEARLAAYEKETTHQIVVLTVPSLRTETIESFSLRVANAWKIGRKDLDNGVLVTVAPNDRKARIELGYGMNRFVSDTTAQQILADSMVPQFRAGRFGHGIELGVERLMEVCRAYKVQP